MIMSRKNRLLFVLLGTLFFVTACENQQSQSFVEAAFWGDYHYVRNDIMDGINVNVRDKDGNTALIAASERNELKIVNLLLRNGANVNIKNKSDQTALQLAVFVPIREKDQMETIKRLLAAGADVNAKDEKGNTALMDNLLLHNPNIQVIKTLIAAGTDVKATNKFGTTALMLAEDSGDTTIVKLLQDSGAKK